MLLFALAFAEYAAHGPAEEAHPRTSQPGGP
jgi:hypothetical protein